ncbi:hypothetical protein BHF71_02870 [Vulcanibacillus modesticaldus]|uniref:Motility accessory factor n=1 Tax=Vulcanibacillus modesticaldus TaxID=337097 RepID=A0A1D2YT85_9BACI|nr:6-hydroxymethylpterin diphosphokinase MptE-like protein [Vulcanibacillus modesticaldus]OEF98886.1 hypothetical protein BHF71_02870 [Vulcanibacillus modesticaldus]
MEKKDELMANFNKNIEYLPSQLLNRILKIRSEEIWENVIIEYTKEGHPICKYNTGQHIFHINSSQPTIEAKNWYHNLAIEDAGALFVYGCGFGYPLFEILKQKQPNTIVIVFEQNIYLFVAMLYYFDLEPIFKTQKFRFFVGKIEEFASEFQALFFTDVFLYSTAPYVVFTPTAQRNFKNEYLAIHSYIFKELSLNIFYLGNDHYDTLLGFHNLIANVYEVIENPYLSILKNKYKDVPAFIIANGPSLDKNIHELKKIKGRGLIISTESAIIPLTKNNIKPDILCVVERIRNAYEFHFKDRKYSDDISLLALALIDRNIFPSFSGPKIPIFRCTESINRWMNNIIGDKESELDAGANVSHLAFEIAVYLGANPIIFVGQDFAYGLDGRTHSKYSVYYEDIGKKSVSKIKSKPVVYTEGNDGTQIPSTQLWLDFKRGLERKIANYPHLEILNATEGGAKIYGTTKIKLSTAIHKYCKTKISLRVDQLINNNKNKINQSERTKKFQNLIDELSLYAAKFRNLCQVAIKGNIRSKQMIELFEQKKIVEIIDILEKAYEDNFKDLKQFMTDNLYYVFLQQVLLIGFHKMNRLGVIKSPERVKKVFLIHEELFHNLNIVCQSVTINFEMSIEKLEQNCYHTLNKQSSP